MPSGLVTRESLSMYQKALAPNWVGESGLVAACAAGASTVSVSSTVASSKRMSGL